MPVKPGEATGNDSNEGWGLQTDPEAFGQDLLNQPPTSSETSGLPVFGSRSGRPVSDRWSFFDTIMIPISEM